jgi:filamentous hemagglutinin
MKEDNFCSGARETEKIRKTTQVGSSLTAGGNLSLNAGKDITVQASNLGTEKGDMELNASGNVNLLSAENTNARSHDRSDSNYGGLEESETKETWNKTSQESSYALSGKNVKVTAGKDFNMKASNLGAAGDAELTAENVNVLAGIDTHEYSYEHSEKSFSGIDVGFSDNKASAGVKYNETTEYSGYSNESAVSSNIGIAGNLKIKAAKDVKIKGSNVAADSAELNAGGDVTITSQETTQKSYEGKKETEMKVSVGIGNGYVDAAQAGQSVYEAEQAVDRAKRAVDDMERLKSEGKASSSAVEDAKSNLAMATANLAQASASFAASVGSAAAAASTSMGTGLYADVTVSRKGTETRTDKTAITNYGSSLQTNKKLKITAGKNINQKGSEVVSIGGDIIYEAKGNINITASEDRYNEKTNSKEINASMSVGTNGLSASANASESESRTNSITNKPYSFSRS